jgi:hypothetical protein
MNDDKAFDKNYQNMTLEEFKPLMPSVLQPE